jgi:hypothetical protein
LKLFSISILVALAGLAATRLVDTKPAAPLCHDATTEFMHLRSCAHIEGATEAFCRCTWKLVSERHSCEALGMNDVSETDKRDIVSACR